MSVPVLFLTAVLVTAAAPVQRPAATPPKPPSSSADERAAALAPAAPAVVEGCVVTARELAGKSTGLGEKLGLNTHFVLISAKVLKGRAPAPIVAGPAQYAIGGLSDEQLTLHVGRRVRMDGSFRSADRVATPEAAAAERPELTATTIRQVPGDCTVPAS
jgi:hypothetical protein